MTRRHRRESRRVRGGIRISAALTACAMAVGAFVGKGVYAHFSSMMRHSESPEEKAHRDGVKKVAREEEEPIPSLPPRVDAVFHQVMDPIQSDPAFRHWAESEVQRAVSGLPDPNQNALVIADKGFVGRGAQLSARGAARLSPDEVFELVKLKLKLAERSERVCEGFWSGGLHNSELGQALDGLSDVEIRRWFELSATGMRLELQATRPPPRIKAADLVDKLADIASALPHDERLLFMNTMEAGLAASPQDGCKTFKLLVKGAANLPPADRDLVLRGVSFSSLVDG